MAVLPLQLLLWRSWRAREGRQTLARPSRLAAWRPPALLLLLLL
jgi:hypothetical protein